MKFVFYLLLLWKISRSFSTSEKDEIIETTEDLDDNYLSDFDRTLVELNHLFVDKTNFIVRAVERKYTDEFLLRGSRWGKSFNLNMLRIFFGIRHDENGTIVPWKQRDIYFKGGQLRRKIQKEKNTFKIIYLNPLKVSRHPDVMEHMGTHPVIYLSFQGCGTSYEKFSNCVINEITTIIESKNYANFLIQYCPTVVHTTTITTLDKTQCEQLLQNPRQALKSEFILENSLFVVGALLTAHFLQPPVILIDDLDYPLHDIVNNRNDIDRSRELLHNLYTNTFRMKFKIFKGVAVGLLRWHGDEMSSDVQNVLTGSNLDQLSYLEEFGFTSGEIELLLNKGSYNVTNRDIEKWYGGFHIGDQTMSNPSSTIDCLIRGGTYRPFWERNNSSGEPIESNFLSNSMLSDDLQITLQKLYTKYKKIIRISTFEDIRIINLIVMGYLTISQNHQNEDEDHDYEVVIPNRETRDFFRAHFKTWIAHKFHLQGKRKFSQEFNSSRKSYEKITVSAVEQILKNDTFPKINDFDANHCEAIFAMLLTVEGPWTLNRTFPRFGSELLNCVIILSPNKDQGDFLFIAVQYTNEARYKIERDSWKEDIRQKTISNLIYFFSQLGKQGSEYVEDLSSNKMKTLFTYISDSRAHPSDGVSILPRSTAQITEMQFWKVFLGVYQMTKRKSKIKQVFGKVWPFQLGSKITSTIHVLQSLNNDRSESLFCI